MKSLESYQLLSHSRTNGWKLLLIVMIYAIKMDVLQGVRKIFPEQNVEIFFLSQGILFKCGKFIFRIIYWPSCGLGCAVFAVWLILTVSDEAIAFTCVLHDAFIKYVDSRKILNLPMGQYFPLFAHGIIGKLYAILNVLTQEMRKL